MPRRWHRTGSPTSTVFDERLGSSSVHCKRVPAGTTISRALALRVKAKRDTARRENSSLHFILHLGRTPLQFGRTPGLSRDFARASCHRWKEIFNRNSTRNPRPERHWEDLHTVAENHHLASSLD